MNSSINTIKLKINTEKATASPPVGPTLGQAGLNIMEFCKDFNKKSMLYKEGLQLQVLIKVQENKSFTYIIKTPSISIFFKYFKELNNSTMPNTITLKQIFHLACLKKQDLFFSHIPLKSICSMLVNSAKAMKIKIILK